MAGKTDTAAVAVFDLATADGLAGAVGALLSRVADLEAAKPAEVPADLAARVERVERVTGHWFGSEYNEYDRAAAPVGDANAG